MSVAPAPLDSIERFLFNAPLYASFKINADLTELYRLYGSGDGTSSRKIQTKLDGYCLYCKKETTFELSPPHVPNGDPWSNLANRHAIESLSLICVRNDSHRIRYYFGINKLVLQKIGQLPSLADIAIDENRTKYRSVLRGENWQELYKAVGLAAHGEGIGSFVYLRRVFERLINSRFDDHKEAEGWSKIDFQKLRMDERIGHLSKYLPAYLVENKKLYSIFSIGIHELDNETCLEFFEIGKDSITFILDDDLKQKEERERREKLSKAVASFNPPGGAN